MANITKRTAKRLAGYLDDGETVEVAVLVEPRGTLGFGAVAIAAMPRTSMRALANRAQQAADEHGGLAAAFPARGAAVAVTDRRVLVAPSNGLKFEEPTIDIAREAMLVGERRRRGLGHRLQLVFFDGSAVEVDAQLGQPLDRLEELLGPVVS